MADSSPAASEIGYGDALAELERILEEIEDDAVDVDVLATKVRRAAELLRVCRERIAAARIEVTQIVADLEPNAVDADADSDGDGDSDGPG
ncbi:MAG: exodeoxyribonuclease VII small subunit [Acidimicrobiales bacterium]